jgi:hypothetical protein
MQKLKITILEGTYEKGHRNTTAERIRIRKKSGPKIGQQH